MIIPVTGKRFAGIALLVLAVVVCAPLASAQDRDAPGQSEFRFARLAFGVNGHRFTYHRGEPWLRDWPEAEFHFLQGVRRMTRIDTDGESHYVSLLDDALYDYPVIYAVKVGYWYLSDEEVARLGAYLERGGTLIVDDFHGPLEWEQFAVSLRKALPDRPIMEIPDEHAIFHVLYDLDERWQIPGRNSVFSGVTWEHPLGTTEHWRAVFDDDGRIMVAINFNMDMGDAWEHADDAFYPEPSTALAYRVGINYLIYSMTH